MNGLGWAIKTKLDESFTLYPRHVNSRLFTLRFLLQRGGCITLISVYEPTLMASENELFYQTLDDTLLSILTEENILLSNPIDLVVISKLFN